MRYVILLCCLLFAVNVSAQQNSGNLKPPPPPPPPAPDEILNSKDTGKHPLIISHVEGMPSPGYDFNKYLQESLHYPPAARKAQITGRVIVRFVVTETGAIEDVVVAKGIGGGCDEEAARVIKNMPPWKPGKQNGKAVRVYFTQPITFML